MERNIRLVIEYDGTAYHGWQSQANAKAVQDILEDALGKLDGRPVSLTGAGRTDAGVHALGQVANFRTSSAIPPDRYSHALNGMLPGDIVVKSSDEVPPEFHARFGAKGKIYRYLIYNAKQPSALMRTMALHIPLLLDADAMRAAALHFVGRHDFTSFRASGGSTGTGIRTIARAELSVSGSIPMMSKDRLICFEIEGDGFLYNMVRIITGTLVDVGRGVLTPDEIPPIMEGRDREAAGDTAPAHGLYLVKVLY